MARVTTVKTSINSNTSQSPNIDSTSWSTDNGTITLNSDLSASINVGDVITDSATNSYLITGVSGAVLTCQDFDTTTDPVTGAATISEAYATITLWEADLDAGTNAEVYKSGDDAQGEGYKNSVFNEAFTIAGGGAVGLNSVTLKPASGEGHDGTPGTGVTIQITTGEIETTGSKQITIDGLEFDRNGGNTTESLVTINPGGAGSGTLQRCLIYGTAANRTAQLKVVKIIQSGGEASVLNNIILDHQNTSTGEMIGLLATKTTTTNVLNNTIVDIRNTNVSGTATGLSLLDDADHAYKNNLVHLITASGGGTARDYNDSSPTNATTSNNLSEDATSPDSSYRNKTITFANAGIDDYHLASGDTDAIDAGVDLVTTPTGVEIDIDGRDRDAEGDTWDIGADEFVSVAVGGINRIIGGGILV